MTQIYLWMLSPIVSLMLSMEKRYWKNAPKGKLLELWLPIVFRISDLNMKKILAALDNDEFLDFEDCLQEECAVEEIADYIVTRNPDDFIKSRVKVIQPDEFLHLL